MRCPPLLLKHLRILCGVPTQFGTSDQMTQIEMCGVPPPPNYQTSYHFGCQSSSTYISECGTPSWACSYLISSYLVKSSFVDFILFCFFILHIFCIIVICMQKGYRKICKPFILDWEVAKKFTKQKFTDIFFVHPLYLLTCICEVMLFCLVWKNLA